MKIFKATLTIKTTNSVTVEDVSKSIEENMAFIELSLSGGNIINVKVSEKE